MNNKKLFAVRILCMILIVVSAGYLIWVVTEEIRNRNLYEGITWENYREHNSDGVAYLEIEGLGLHYPVAQGEDNTFYLDHSYLKEKSEYGSVFCDYQNRPEAPLSKPQNLVFYGHSMYTGSMFAPLKEYLLNADRVDFLERCAYIDVDVLGDARRYRVFAAYYADAESTEETQTMFGSLTAMTDWCRNRAGQSLIPVPELPEVIVQTLTLQTCNYNSRGERIYVCAYLEEKNGGK